MLTQLATIKARLALTDTEFDTLLTNAIAAVSARFDRESNRTLARTVDFQQEFDSGAGEIIAVCYPIETVNKFELKFTEAEGWVEQPGPDYVVRAGCVLSLAARRSTPNARRSIARVTYTGGYVLPDATPGAGQAPLPADIEQAAVEQVAFWFQNRERLGVLRQWPKGGTYEQFADLDLLPSVRAVLERHERMRL